MLAAEKSLTAKQLVSLCVPQLTEVPEGFQQVILDFSAVYSATHWQLEAFVTSRFSKAFRQIQDKIPSIVPKLNGEVRNRLSFFCPTTSAENLKLVTESFAPLFEDCKKVYGNGVMVRLFVQNAEEGSMSRELLAFGRKPKASELAISALEAKIRDFSLSADREMFFPADLSSKDRSQAHTLAEQYGLIHVSEGTGAQRRLKLAKQ